MKFINNCVFILTGLNFGHLQSVLHWMQHTYQDIFSHCSKWVLRPLSASDIFYLFHIGKMFPFENFFHLEKQPKSLRMRSGQ